MLKNNFDLLSVRGTVVGVFCNCFLVSSRNALSLQRGIDGVVGRYQTMAGKETTVSVAPMHFIFA